MKNIIYFLFITKILFVASSNFTNIFFSATIFKKICKKSQANFIVSPFSLENILALTYSGSIGKTAEELKSCLNFSNDSKNIETTFESFTTSFANSKLYNLKIANKMFIEKSFKIKNNFKKLASKSYQTEIENLDFSDKTEAIKVINNWVKEQTNNKISDLINSEDLTSKSKIIMLNTILLKANWSVPFLGAYTQKLNFSLTPTDQILTPTMLLHEQYFNFFKSKILDAKFLELPFKGNKASMILVVPNKIDGLSILETRIKKVLETKNFQKRLVNVALPVFRVETKTDLKRVLQKMGVSAIFHKKNADLSGISGQKGDLVVDKIVQKTFIDVNEEGVDAGTATYNLIAIPISASPVTPINFKVDRPFIFYIKVKNVVVFIGRVTDPREL